MSNKLGFSVAQVRDLQGILLECYAQAKEAKVFNAQLFYVWSKMDLANPDHLGRILMLCRGEFWSKVHVDVSALDDTEIGWRRDFQVCVARFFHCAHKMIDDLAAREDYERDLAKESSLSSPVEEVPSADPPAPMFAQEYDKLRDKEIFYVDSTCANQIIIHFTDGSCVRLEAIRVSDYGIYGIEPKFAQAEEDLT